MAQRNAASVLPVPVGAAMRVCLPLRIDGHPSCCGGLALPKRSSNQRRTTGENPPSGSGVGMISTAPLWAARSS
ncbi:MAG TPA: hypothetical protein VE258_13635, partial [Ktedonobacterales bacterium]|nr:hypothetical protein [Ktedonobacterales bacterium]